MQNSFNQSNIIQEWSTSENLYYVLGFYLVVWIILIICLYFFKNYRKNVNIIFEDIKLLYKNFIHWNVSKIIILIYSFLFSTIISLPFIWLLAYLSYNVFIQFDQKLLQDFLVNGKIDNELINIIFLNTKTILVIFLLLSIILCIFLLIFTYGNLLLQNVYKSYLSWKILKYKSNLYFSKQYFLKYIFTFGWVSLYMLIPVLILLWFLIIIRILWYFWFITIYLTNTQSIVLWISTIIILFFIIILFVYLYIRLAFSYIALIYTKNINDKTKKYIDESFKITKNKILKIITLIIPVMLLIWLISLIKDLLPSYQIIHIIYGIIMFLCLDWVLYMLYVSIYWIIKKENIIPKKIN